MITHEELFAAIKFIHPSAEFIIRGTEIEWLDKKYEKPTDEEISNALEQYKAKQKADQIEIETKRKALLDKLGITEEEAAVLLG